MLKICLFLAMALVGAADSYRILAFMPLPGRSHHFVFRPILEELASKGHQVVYVTGVPYEKVPTNIKQINVVNYLMEAFGDEKFDMVSFGEMSVPMSVIALYEMGLKIAGPALGNPEVQKIIHSNERFDAVIFESYFVQEYLSAFIHKFGAVGIDVMPLGDCSWVNEMSGLPDNIAYQIDYKNENTDVLDFCGRLYNYYVTTTATLGGYFYLWRMEAVVDKYFNYTGAETRPSLPYLASNRSLILSNSHFALGYPVPLAPHHKEIGGINIRPNKPLPKDLQKYMDEAKSGVIYMSLGSNMNVSDVTNDKLREDFMSVFGTLKQKVLLKWEKEYTGKLPANVKISNWFPQQDILAHKNLVLFITHGGILSISEAVHHGVPLVGIPFFGDQTKNLIQVETAGYGRLIKFRNLTTESISWAINEVLQDPRYKTEAVRRSAMLRDRRFSPAEEAVYWIEHSIRFPNALTPRGAYLSYFPLHGLDIIGFFAGISILVAGGVALAFFTLLAGCFCLRWLFNKKTVQPTKKAKKN